MQNEHMTAMTDLNGNDDSATGCNTQHSGDNTMEHGVDEGNGSASARDESTDALTGAHEVSVNTPTPEFRVDPGAGFGFTDARELETELAAEDGLPTSSNGDEDPSLFGTDVHAELSEEERAAHAEEQSEARADADEAAAAYARASMRDFDAPAPTASIEGDDPVEAHRGDKPRQLVIVNDVPGDETRIAILEQGKLTQFYSERAATSTNVGSIYKARVVNVEPAIQAAFVDFGEGANGFLHISDLHPKYFPGDSDRTEKVGRKIPRRSRPMMQEALRRGQEIVVQVLKEGLGSKGPTVTSYLSIPGRLLVMMPDMDNVGVSRKVDDEDSRRQMRKILDSLNLPEGFGFILRTAGFDSTRTELARDAQYLTRLWQVMEKRMNAVGAPCGLYTEGDILLRTIRDCIDTAVDGIVVDSESSFHRAKAFLDVVAPKTSARVHFYDRRMPIFHAFDVERQVDLIHSREVPLPSGGALVLDQTEALVAIDVNSGRSRSARDSETNAYQTNQEAVDEIARQIRLRDLGGVIVSDLIDMRMSKHRRDIEDRLKHNLSKDRAKSTVTQISEFGIVEMTRQRMRPSLRKTHYMDCPHCAGHGEIRMPDTVASDAMRRMQLVLDMQSVARIEVVCSSKVAAVLLSRKRGAMGELEELFGKKIDVRISEALAVDRVDLYAYDERNADVDLDRPMRIPTPALASLPTDIDDDEHDARSGRDRGQGQSGETPDGQGGGGRRRRRRRRKPAAADATSIILSGGFDDLPEIDEDEESVSETLARSAAESAARAAREGADGEESSESDGESRESGLSGTQGERGGRRGRRGRRRGRGGRDRGGEHGGEHGGEQGGEAADAESQGDGQSNQQSRPAQPQRAARPVAPPPPPREPSDPIRVHAIAKEIELTSKDVLAKCAELGIEVKGHQSLLSGEQGDLIRKAYGKPPFDVPEPTPEPETDATGEADAASGEGGSRRKRRRRRGRGRGGRGGSDAEASDAGQRSQVGRAAQDGEGADESGAQDAGDGDTDSGDSDGDAAHADGGDESASTESQPSEGGERKKRRRSRGGRGRNRGRENRGDNRGGGGDNRGGSGGNRGGGGGNRGGDGDNRGGGGGNRGGGGDNRGGGGGNRGGGGDSRGSGNDNRSGGGGNRGGGGDNRGGGADNRGGGNNRGDGGGNRGGGGDNRGGGRDRRGGGGRDRDGRGNRGSGGGGGGGERSAPSSPSAAPAPQTQAPSAPAAKAPRSLYGGRLRKLAPGEMPKGGGDE